MIRQARDCLEKNMSTTGEINTKRCNYLAAQFDTSFLSQSVTTKAIRNIWLGDSGFKILVDNY
jgi:hypothetical protein